MTIRVVLIARLLLGLLIGVCGGLEQAILGHSIYLVYEASTNDVAPRAEAREGLDTSYTMTSVSMYLGVIVGILSIIGLSLSARRERFIDKT